ncbi:MULTISPECIES: hypothetical protein [unclassified Rhodococcus (in: high G+C Gram-positive bacteria)]|uniref:hypothetical protein n=1 Tax=unclassified Rhodococcus (in: high G+C Gram-positive bacteria) TaxID=192944 RepID=UPI000E0A8D45|nr:MULTISPECIES: hypothetical protein [unclassified Rhodococcus (in: high G+C Gram-positive bacteria)]QKT10434.1 hypothetical protein HUN07_06625 [Rhodococcus sp. W8901]RDI35553.1 hypothetical protein DEU38_10130 [Rhodococcus sp. AG1013]
MIDDLIELAYSRHVVRETLPCPDGCDEYVLGRVDAVNASIRLWVRPDGRFSRAQGDEGQLSLGQVMTACGLSYAARRTAAPAA